MYGIHDEFPQVAGLRYLNHAAVAPWPQRAVVAVSRFAEQNARHGARDYPAWLQVENTLRERLTRLFNAPSSADIALVKNTSEALSFVAFGLDWSRPPRQMNSTSAFYAHSDQWRYERNFTDYHTVPKGDENSLAKGHTMDMQVRAVRQGWLPFYPQFPDNPVELVKEARVRRAKLNFLKNAKRRFKRKLKETHFMSSNKKKK